MKMSYGDPFLNRHLFYLERANQHHIQQTLGPLRPVSPKTGQMYISLAVPVFRLPADDFLPLPVVQYGEVLLLRHCHQLKGPLPSRLSGHCRVHHRGGRSRPSA